MGTRKMAKLYLNSFFVAFVFIIIDLDPVSNVE